MYLPTLATPVGTAGNAWFAGGKARATGERAKGRRSWSFILSMSMARPSK